MLKSQTSRQRRRKSSVSFSQSFDESEVESLIPSESSAPSLKKHHRSQEKNSQFNARLPPIQESSRFSDICNSSPEPLPKKSSPPTRFASIFGTARRPPPHSFGPPSKLQSRPHLVRQAPEPNSSRKTSRPPSLPRAIKPIPHKSDIPLPPKERKQHSVQSESTLRPSSTQENAPTVVSIPPFLESNISRPASYSVHSIEENLQFSPILTVNIEPKSILTQNQFIAPTANLCELSPPPSPVLGFQTPQTIYEIEPQAPLQSESSSESLSSINEETLDDDLHLIQSSSTSTSEFARRRIVRYIDSVVSANPLILEPPPERIPSPETHPYSELSTSQSESSWAFD
jgi:hypothetical protein